MYALRQIANRIGGFVRVRPTLGRLVLKLIPDLEWTLSLAEIGPMKINIRRHRSYWLRHPLYDSAFTFGALARLVHEGDVVFDVGANIGLYARYMLEVFKAGRVVAFEPMSHNFRLLRENLECCADRALLFNLAVSDTDGREFLELDDVMSCTAVLDSVTGGQACEGRRLYGLGPARELVEVRRLDTLVQEGAIPGPNVIKVDVEGAEAKVLAGARLTLERYAPHLVIEFHGLSCAHQAVAILAELGYSVFGYARTSGGRTEYCEVTSTLVETLRDRYDLQFVVASRMHDLIARPIEFWEGVPREFWPRLAGSG